MLRLRWSPIELFQGGIIAVVQDLFVYNQYSFTHARSGQGILLVMLLKFKFDCGCV
jgi:hypothetical protein